MVEKASFVFRFEKMDETWNYILEEIKHNDLMSEKYKKSCKYLNYVQHMFILASTVTDCVCFNFCICFISYYFYITSSAVGIKICAIIARIRKYKLIIKKKKKKHDKIVLLGKDELNTVENLISKALIDSYDKFVSVNKVLREYNEIEEEIKNPEISVEYTI